MAGVYIPDIEFPSYPWSGILVVVLKDDGTAHFTKAETLEQKSVKFTVVPKHGRLVDVDELLSRDEYNTLDERLLTREQVLNAKTVIPEDN